MEQKLKERPNDKTQNHSNLRDVIGRFVHPGAADLPLSREMVTLIRNQGRKPKEEKTPVPKFPKL